MCAGVSKSGSPISRWMTSFPCRSSSRARARTENAVSVPSRSRLAANPGVTVALIGAASILRAGLLPAVLTGKGLATDRARILAGLAAPPPAHALDRRRDAEGDAEREQDGLDRALLECLAADVADQSGIAGPEEP